MCKSCDKLKAENARLTELLDLKVRADLIGRLQVYLGVSPMQARFLLCLYSAHGGPVPHADLFRQLPSHGKGMDARPLNYLHVTASQIRKRIPLIGIRPVAKMGFRLAPMGQELVRRALSADPFSFEEAA